MKTYGLGLEFISPPMRNNEKARYQEFFVMSYFVGCHYVTKTVACDGVYFIAEWLNSKLCTFCILLGCGTRNPYCY